MNLAIFPEDEDIPLAVLERYWELGRSATRRLCDQLNDLSLLREFDQKRESIRLHDVIRRVLMDLWKEELPSLHSQFLNLMCPASGRWQDLSAGQIYVWKRLGYHLVESERGAELQELLVTFSFLEAKLIATDVNALLADYEPLIGENQELRLIRDTLRLSAHVLSKDRKQLASQLLGRLLGRKESSLISLMEEARSWAGSIWLRPRKESLTEPGGALLRTLEGHTTWVTAVPIMGCLCAISSSDDDRMLRVWDVESGCTLKTLEGHTSEVTAVAVVGVGCIVSASHDQTLRVWDLKSGRTLKVLEGHTAWVTAVAVVDDCWAVSASHDRTLRVWDLESGQTLKILKGHLATVTAVAVVDSARVISGSYDRTLRVWDLESGQTLETLKGHTDGVAALALLDGGCAISASYDKTLRVWNLENGQSLKTLEGHLAQVTAVAVVDGVRVVSGSYDRTLRVWDLERGQTLEILEGHMDSVTAVAIINRGSIISASHDKTLRVWDLENGQYLKAFKGQHPSGVRILAPMRGGRISSLSTDGTLQEWDLENGESIKIQKDLVDAGSGPRILHGLGKEGGGPIFGTSSEASGATGLPRLQRIFSGAPRLPPLGYGSCRAVENVHLAALPRFPQPLENASFHPPSQGVSHSSHSPDDGCHEEPLIFTWLGYKGRSPSVQSAYAPSGLSECKEERQPGVETPGSTPAPLRGSPLSAGTYI